jgi:putative endonuclease
MSEARWSVYIIRCGDGSLYTGIATDVERRFGEHVSQGPKTAKYLRGRLPLEIVYRREIGSRFEASASTSWKANGGRVSATIPRGLPGAQIHLDPQLRPPGKRVSGADSPPQGGGHFHHSPKGCVIINSQLSFICSLGKSPSYPFFHLRLLTFICG